MSGPLAQWSEQETHNPLVAGSILNCYEDFGWYALLKWGPVNAVIVVAHRLSTAQRADHIAEYGTHADFLAHNGRYAALAAAWQKSQVTN